MIPNNKSNGIVSRLRLWRKEEVMSEVKIPRVIDRNGREIKIGDRVRIIAEECNRFMHDFYEEDWIPEMHWSKDMYGTATFDGFFQVVAENGAMLWDLSWSGKEIELEVL